jgi:CubicO group peptidase (beta-lactamase class C family)
LKKNRSKWMFAFSFVSNLSRLKHRLLFLLMFVLGLSRIAKGQMVRDSMKSVLENFILPEIAYAVVTADSVLELEVLGRKQYNTDFLAEKTDRFHIGSNTKAITACIAFDLVERGQIKWDTRFFDLFPEMKSRSRKAYHNVTLEQLFTFRSRVPKYTYFYDRPVETEIVGTPDEQRKALVNFYLIRKPQHWVDGLTPSNLAYVMAGMMLEKASGQTYKDQVRKFGEQLNIEFEFDPPNVTNIDEPWGHNVNYESQKPVTNVKLNWLLPAGNINVSMPEYVRFIQNELKGVRSDDQATLKRLYSLPGFSFGWFNHIDERGHRIANNEGNAAFFTSRVEVDLDAGLAFIIFTNVGASDTSKALDVIMQILHSAYDK